MLALNDFEQFREVGAIFLPKPSVQWRGLPKNICYTEESLKVVFDVHKLSKVTNLKVIATDHHAQQSIVLFEGINLNSKRLKFDFELPNTKTSIRFTVILYTRNEAFEFSETVNVNHPAAQIHIQDYFDQVHLYDDVNFTFSSKYITQFSLTVDEMLITEEVIEVSQRFPEKVTEVLLNTEELGEKIIRLTYQDLEGKVETIEFVFNVNPRKLNVELIKSEKNAVELLISNSSSNRFVLKNRGIDMMIPDHARIEHTFIWEQQAELICLDDAGDEYSFPVHMKFQPVKLNLF